MPALIVTGLGYGDEGKGAVVDHLARKHNASGVVFVNGGAQRAHNVVLPNGFHHTFSQFSSGTLAGAMTYHSERALVNPVLLFQEWDQLTEKGLSHERLLHTIAVHQDALITTPMHMAANTLKEMLRDRHSARHGTCGHGINETIVTAKAGISLKASELGDEKHVYETLHDLQTYYKRSLMQEVYDQIPGGPYAEAASKIFDFQPISDAMEIYKIFAKVIPLYEHLNFEQDETIIFEGSQGVLLDEFHGFFPHVTRSTTTGENAKKILATQGLDGYKEEIHHIGVMRSYMTRHGEGPFVTEDESLRDRFPEPHNTEAGQQGTWRIGWTDLRAMEYAISCAWPIDELAVTHLDRVSDDWKICLGYRTDIRVPISTDEETWKRQREIALSILKTTEPQYVEFDDMDPLTLIEFIEAKLELPVTIFGNGPTSYTSEIPQFA